MSKYCPKCGEELIDTAKFCKNCGTNLENNTNTTQTINNNFQVPTVEKSHTLAIVAGYIMALLIPLFGIIIAVYLLTRDSERARKHGKYVLILTVILWILYFITRL